MSKVNYIEYINVKEEDVVLNKLKKMLMKQNPEPILDNQDLEGTDLKWTNNNPEPGQVDDMVEIEPTQEEVDEMNNQADTDPEYLEYSSEAVGYENREQQWDTYRIIANYINEGDSVLDFGCAR